MRVTPAPAEPALQPPVAEPATRVDGASFAALHAASMARLSSVKPTAGAANAASMAARSTSGGSAKSAAEFKVPKSETYEAVPGQEYEEIMSGPRNGMFINRSGNARDGEAFVLVKRSGREFHIYGKGADREVVHVDPAARPDGVKPDSVKPDAVKPDAVSPAGDDKANKAVTYEDVPGRAFDEVTSGPRNGMFVNRSGNARDGETFVLVKRPDHELHVYGTGKDRLVVRVISPAKTDAKPHTTPADEPVAPMPVAASSLGASAV